MFRPHTALLYAAFAAVVPTPALAQVWQPLARVAGHFIEVDSASVRQAAGSLLEARLRWWGPGSTEVQSAVIDLSFFDCGAARMRTVESQDLTVAWGTASTRPRDVDPARWTSYSQGSLGRVVIDAVCRRFAARPSDGAGA